jgi:hypothetical protein
MIKRNLAICHADSKNSLNAFWEKYMLLKPCFTVTSRAPTRPIFMQISTLHPGDLILLNRNLGHLGGVIGFSTVLSEATPPEQYDYDHSTKQGQWISEIAVEPWLVLSEPLSHTEMSDRLNRLGLGPMRVVSATVNPISAPQDTALIDLFFEKLALKFK